MLSIKVILSTLGFTSLLLLFIHLLSLPVYPFGGWFFHGRISKDAYFQLQGPATSTDGWAYSLGNNRPTTDRAHEIISEVEVRIQHQIRESGTFRMSITGESEADIDAFLAMVRRDEPRARLIQQDPSRSSYFWRQYYLWLLIANVALIGVVLWLLHRNGNKQKA